MYKVRWNLNETELLTLYHTLIEPYLQYRSKIWGVAVYIIINKKQSK